MEEEHTTLNEEKLTQLKRDIFQEEFKKQEVYIANIINSNYNAKANKRNKERSDRPEMQR